MQFINFGILDFLKSESFLNRRPRPMEDFIFCEERKGQRISKAVCQKNLESGKCIKDLLKCGKAKKPKAHTEKPKGEGTPKIVTEATICGPLFAGFDNNND
jgi:hypothetical protein